MAKYCGKCGSPISDNMKFCGKCGEPVRQIPTLPIPKDEKSNGMPLRAFVVALLIMALVGVGIVASGFFHHTSKDSAELSGAHDMGLQTLQPQSSEDLSQQPSESSDLEPLAFWGVVNLTYKGWAGMGAIDEVLLEDGFEYVKQYVTFRPAEEYTNLKDGDIVVINAEYDEEELRNAGLIIEDGSCEFSVYGVPTIKRASSFSEGLSWVEIQTGVTKRWSVVDTDGSVIYQLDEGSYPVSHFCNGVCIVDYNRIIDKEGNTIWSVENDGWRYADEHWGKENVKSIHISHNDCDVVNNSVIENTISYIEDDFFGYTLISFEIDTFDYTGPVTGFLDCNGTWYFEPTSAKGAGFSYQGNGLYYTYNNESILEDGYYNVLKNELIWEEDTDKNNFNDTIDNWKNEYAFERHDGLVWFFPGNLDQTYFINSTGQKAIDLSNYQISVPPDPAFVDGYCLLRIENDQHSEYYTVIDQNGNEMFEPRKTLNLWPSSISDYCSEGLYWENADDTVTYYTVKGEKAFECEISLKYGSNFKEGLALVQDTDDVYYFIDSMGNIIF